ncbi:MAG TPA: transcriptional regulator [Lentisphaeria bacterium]|nr:MAG: hypothetical protein A2X47_02790 [Lentisphaerae bacterium GWF2_38_69]HBM15390.1 transcriptional regulator [Lentisphaeria bacterium]
MNILNKNESDMLEFKSQWSEDCLKAVSSFANSKGGILYIGIDDKGRSVKLHNYAKALEDIPNTIRNKLGILPLVTSEKLNSDMVIKIDVAPSSVPISFNGKFYIRSGSTVQELQGKHLADFLIKKSGLTWDQIVEERADLNSLNLETIEDFKRFSKDRIPSISQETDIRIILRKLNLLKDGAITRGAALLFGKEPQKLYIQAIVKIGKFLSETDIQTTDIVKGNLFTQLEMTLEILRTKYLKSNIHFEGIHRREILEYPYDALREAIINSLIHRDYLGTSHIQIRVYDDKLIIMNEGKLPPEVPVEKLKTNHLSVPRNSLLAETFYLAGFIESWGRGTVKIVEKCREQGLPEPDFTEENGVMTATFYCNRLNEKKFIEMGLNSRQAKLILYLRQHVESAIADLSQVADGVSIKTIQRDMDELFKKGFISFKGEKKGRKYFLSDIYRT